jgi:hypothetical protein
VYEGREQKMDEQSRSDNSLIEMNFPGLDDRLALMADHLGGAQTAIAGLESGTVAWGLSFFNSLLLKTPTEA